MSKTHIQISFKEKENKTEIHNNPQGFNRAVSVKRKNTTTNHNSHSNSAQNSQRSKRNTNHQCQSQAWRRPAMKSKNQIHQKCTIISTQCLQKELGNSPKKQKNKKNRKRGIQRA